MSEEIICLSSSDDEDACIENSSNIKTKSSDVGKRKLSESDEKIEVKKQKIDNGLINVDECEESSKSKSNLNSDINKSLNTESTKIKFGSISTKRRSPSPVAGTSKYFDLIENQTSKKVTLDTQEKKLSSITSQNSKSLNKSSVNEIKEKHSTPITEKPVKKIIPQLVVKEKVPIPDSADDALERIFEICRKKKNVERKTSEMGMALQKVKGYFDQLKPADKDCEEFKSFLNNCLSQILNSDKCFKHLFDIKKEIERRINKKKKTKTDNIEDNAEQNDQDKNSKEVEEIELTEDEAKKVKILEKKIKECKRRIEKLENEEVDFDEEENSSYLMVDRYKKKMVELCDELSRIAKDRILRKQIHKRLLKRKDISDEMTGITYVDDAIIRFVNSSIKQANELKHIKNPNAVASYLFMPDYVDILQCIKKCNQERKLELKNKKMEKLAEKAFKAVGNYLKKQRLLETDEYLTSYVENSEGDPAKNNQDLRIKLKNNKEVGIKKLEEIFSKYVAKQERLSSEDSSTQNDDNGSFEYDSYEEDDSSGINKASSNTNKDNIPSRDEHNSFDRDKSLENRKKLIPLMSSDDENEIVEKKKTSKENNESDKNELNKENIDNTKSNTSDETSSTKKLINSMDMASNITHDTQVQEKNQSTKKINEVVTILSEICKINNSPSNNTKKAYCESMDDDVEILSDTSDTNKKNNDGLENESSEDIILEIEDEFGIEDPLSFTNSNAKEDNIDNHTSTSDVICVRQEKKSNNEKNNSNREIKTKSIVVFKYSDEKSITERNSKVDKGDNSSKIAIENSTPVLKKNNVGKVYPLQARDNHEKLAVESDHSIENSSTKEEYHTTSTKNASSADKTLATTKESSFLKVKSFAKPPESWTDNSSPEKPAKNLKLPIKQVLQEMSKPECVDLTNENDIRSSSSTRIINPLALKKHRIPVNKLVVVKNVVNNYNISLSTDGVKGNSRNVPQTKVQLVNPQFNKKFLLPKTTRVQVNQVPPNNHNQRTSEISTSIVRTPFVTLPSSKKKNDNSNSSAPVK